MGCFQSCFVRMKKQHGNQQTVQTTQDYKTFDAQHKNTIRDLTPANGANPSARKDNDPGSASICYETDLSQVPRAAPGPTGPIKRTRKRKVATRLPINSELPATDLQMAALGPNPIFTTYELIEALMLQMTSFDLTVAAHVCKAWRKVLTRSKPIRQYIDALPQAGRKSLGLMNERYEYLPPVQRTWHVLARVPKGKLFLARVNRQELCLFTPANKSKRIICLDEAYEKQVITTDKGRKRLIWSDNNGLEVCNTLFMQGYFDEYMELFYGTQANNWRTHGFGARHY